MIITAVGRLLVLVLLVVAAVWLVRRALRAARTDGEAPAARSAGDLVRCAHCGLLLPRAESREREGSLYCGEEHARLGPRGG